MKRNYLSQRKRLNLWNLVSLKALVVILVLFNLSPAFAFEGSLEFGGLSTSETDSLDWPHLIDSEYASDLLTYMPTLDQEYRWLSSSKAFMINIGSLSSKEFFIYNSYKLKAELLKEFELGFYGQKYSDLEEQNQFSIIEFKYHKKHWGLGVYGEAAYHKAENDIGITLEVYPNKNHKIRFFHTWTDFERHKRNHSTDEFKERPLTYGLTGLWTGDKTQKEFVQYSLRKDAPVNWYLPASSEIHRYQYLVAAIKGQKFQTNMGKISFRTYWDNKKESLSGRGEVKRYRHLNLIRWQPPSYKIKSWTPQLGLGYQWRRWQLDTGEVSSQDLQPHIIFKSSQSPLREGHYKWRLGYENNLHKSFGDKTLIESSDLEKNKLQHRANLWWDWHFTPTGTLSFTISLDLDQFGSDSTWEGGAGHLVWVF